MRVLQLFSMTNELMNGFDYISRMRGYRGVSYVGSIR